MSTRLYPMLDGDSTMKTAKFLGLGLGTVLLYWMFGLVSRLIDKIWKQYAMTREDMHYKLYCFKERFQKLSILEEFILYGWGSPKHRVTYSLMKMGNGNEYSGYTEKTSDVMSIISCENIRLNRQQYVMLRGIQWG